MGVIDSSTNEEIRIKVDQKRVDAVAARSIKDVCKMRIDENPRDIHFDFSDVAFINSAGIGNLLYIRQLLKKSSKDLYVDAATAELKSLFKELLLNNYFIIT